MKLLLEYVEKQAQIERNSVEGYEDVAFFFVKANVGASADEFRALLDSQVAPLGLDLFDHQEHSFIEIGGVLGDQGLALKVMGLGASLGMWQLLTPKSVLGVDNRSDMGAQMAGTGMVTICTSKVKASA